MSGYENKYEPLYDFLMQETRADFVLTFEQIEEILGFALPAARTVPNGGTTIRRSIRAIRRRPSIRPATTRGGLPKAARSAFGN